MKRIFLFIVCCFIVSLHAQQPDTGKGKLKVYHFAIREDIMPPAEKTTRDALAMADSLHADLILLSLDTYGGQVDVADNIRTMLLNAKIPVWVFVENNAASAGAFISIACDSIYMRPGATIGASTVVDQNGEKVGEKYQAFMRSRMRSTAEQNGRNPDIAEAMVEGTHTIAGVIDSGQVVSLTVKEAMQVDFCDGEYEDIESLLKGEGIDNYELIEYHETAVSSIVKFFLRPAVSGILITIIVLAIFFELKAPGIGIATVVACVAAILYFVPLYLEGLAAYWEIALFVVGIALLLVELLVIPGFGITGVLGASFIFFSLVLALVKAVPGNGPVPLPATDELLKALLTVIISMFGSFGIILLFGRSALNSRYFQRVEVATEQHRSEGYVAREILPSSLVGKAGIVITQLKPTGKVEIDGEEYDGIVQFGYLEKGKHIVVTGIDNFMVIVKSV
jgi:membrane-bound serine protease (ClpP class)